MSSLSFAAFLACTALQAPAATPQMPGARAAAPASVAQDPVDEVIGNVRAQPLGPATVGDLALPEEFLRRYSGRIVRSAFEERFRVVIDDSGMSPAKDPVVARDPAAANGATQLPPPNAPSSSSTSTIRIGVGIACGLALVWLVVRGRKQS